jgi:hypothetical protein
MLYAKNSVEDFKDTIAKYDEKTLQKSMSLQARKKRLNDRQEIPQFLIHLPGSFWGITAFFNPAGYKNKYENYRLFRDNSKSQGLNLVAVELAFDDDPFTLKKDMDAEILIQIRGTREKNLVWQKERLLNIGLGRLPQDCDKVCWVDCDIIFKNDHWIKETSELLGKYVVVQPFEYVARLPKGVYDLSEDELGRLGIGDMENKKCQSYSYKTVTNTTTNSMVGFVWAMRRAFIQKNLFYDSDPTGNQDEIMAYSFVSGRIPDYVTVRRFLNDAMRSDHDMYASKVYKEVQGSVYYSGGTILHLWYGSMKHRLYVTRCKILQIFSFDPSRDIRVGHNGLWEWSSDKPELHKAIGEYLERRNEDGKSSIVTSLIIDELTSAQERLDAIEISIPYRIYRKSKRIYDLTIFSKKTCSLAASGIKGLCKKTNLIIGAAHDLCWDEINRWAYSLNKHCPSGKKVIITYGINRYVMQKIQNNKIEVFQARYTDTGEPLNYSSWNQNKVFEYRFYHAYQFLKQIDPENIGWVIFSDVRDIVFQSDPIEWLKENAKDYDIVISSERMTYENEFWSCENMKKCYGIEYFNLLKNKPIMNGGLIAGKAAAVMDLFSRIYFKTLTASSPNADQAALNLIIYTEPLNYKIKFSQAGDGWYCHAGTLADPLKRPIFRPHLLEEEPVFNNGVIYTANGKKYCIVHQYDRVPEWKMALACRYAGPIPQRLKCEIKFFLFHHPRLARIIKKIRHLLKKVLK